LFSSLPSLFRSTFWIVISQIIDTYSVYHQINAMKFSSIALTLPLAAFAAIAVDTSAYSENSVEVSPGPPQIRKDATRKFFKFGPYTLKGRVAGQTARGGMMGGGDTQTVAASPSGANFCGDCTVLSGKIILKYTDGTIANASNGVYVHHILTTGLKSSPGFVRSCGSIGGTSGFVGNGDDNSNEPTLYASKDGSLESGYWLSASDRFMAQFVLVNYNPEPKKVEVHYDLEYLPGHVGKPVKSSLISASCTGIRTSKMSAVNTTSSPMSFTEDGYIVLARGHLHDGGVAMHLAVNRKVGGTYKCTSKAIYGGKLATGAASGHGHADTIADMQNCNPHPIKVSTGDTMVMTAEYNLAAHPLRETSKGKDQVMGMFRMIFASGR
jgi:hypothetical protein